jgi:hypothetical protein
MSEFAGRIGVARADITPPAGIYSRNWGAAKIDVAEGVHRPLTATVMTFERLVLVGLDLGWWRTREDEWFVRGAILKTLELRPEELMINLSHTHAGPSICCEDSPMVRPYLEKIRDALIGSIRKALDTAEPATLTWAYGRCNLAANRDQRDGGRFVVGYNPAAPADDTLLVGRIMSNRHLGTIVNYACHGTTLAWDNTLISPDFVGSLRETVEGPPCLFLQGASGDLAPREQYSGDPALADKHGRQLGHAVLSTMESMLPPRQRLVFSHVVESSAALGVWTYQGQRTSDRVTARLVDVELPLKPMELGEYPQERFAQERWRRAKRVKGIVGDGPAAKMPLWVWRLGDSLLVGQPNEAYSKLQVELRKRPQPVAVMNLTNGSCGYLPEAHLFGEDLYPVWQTPFERGCLEAVLEKADHECRALCGSV